jgi:hypothetical protein
MQQIFMNVQDIFINVINTSVSTIVQILAATAAAVLAELGRQVLLKVKLDKSIEITKKQEDLLAEAIKKGIFYVMEEERLVKKSDPSASLSDKEQKVYEYVISTDILKKIKMPTSRDISNDIKAALNFIRKDVTVGNPDELKDPLNKI